MRHLRRLLPLLAIPLALVVAGALLSGGGTVYADDQPPPPPAGGDAGMGEAGMGEPDAPDPDDDESDSPQQLIDNVKKAIEKGVRWLKQRQMPDGSWGLIEGNKFYDPKATGEAYKHPAGATALALYTLLKCKEPLDDPIVKKGFKYLRDRFKLPGSAYETSMMLLAVTATADPFKKFSASASQGEKVKLTGEWRDWAQKLKDYLLKKREKAKTLGWRYMTEGVNPAPGGEQDMSSTQLAALALLACERCGLKTESKVWHDLITFTMKQQADDGPEWDRAVYDRAPKSEKEKAREKSGGGAAPGGADPDKGRYGPQGQPVDKPIKDKARGFAYIKSETLPPDEGQPTSSMTACGIGNIHMSRYVLGKRDDPEWRTRDQKLILQSVYDGCAWLDMNWQPAANSVNKYHFYYMYCCERAFDLIGNMLIGKHNWYIEMAQQLVGLQKDKGYWDSNSTHKPREVLDTCFALLVLKRSTKGGIPYGSITSPGDEPPADNRGK